MYMCIIDARAVQEDVAHLFSSRPTHHHGFNKSMKPKMYKPKRLSCIYRYTRHKSLPVATI